MSLSGAKVTTSERILDTNMEYTMPSRIIVLVEKELSSMYERLRIKIRDTNANSAARITEPEKGSRGSWKPKAIASAAPREAPLEMPNVEPSASGFFKSPCMAAPHTEREAPLSATQSTRGKRTASRMEAVPGSDASVPVSAARKTCRHSLTGMSTLPRQTAASIAASVSPARPIQVWSP